MRQPRPSHASRAYLLVTKTPPSCTFKYDDAMKYTGKECKVSQAIGIQGTATIGAQDLHTANCRCAL
eukprot:jgi/Botrbrau1/22972/Bobra.0030s0044.1